ncbi:MAG TPA: hypothetical protein VH397_09230 [Xanthobacteraceae bacterium]|jgi:hypothetical protein
MIASDKIPVFALAFGVAYAAIYAVCTEVNLPLLTYHPATGEIDFLWQPPQRGPAMYWYGWMLTSLIGALLLAWIATMVPEPWLQRAITCGSAAAVAYLILYTLALLVYDKATVELGFLKSRWLSAGAAVAAAVVVTYLLPPRWSKRVWHGWILVVPAAAIAVLGYYLTPFFTR